jgi:hypothetical protein
MALGVFIILWESMPTEYITRNYHETQEQLIHYWKGAKFTTIKEPIISIRANIGFWHRPLYYQFLKISFWIMAIRIFARGIWD